MELTIPETDTARLRWVFTQYCGKGDLSPYASQYQQQIDAVVRRISASGASRVRGNITLPVLSDITVKLGERGRAYLDEATGTIIITR